MARNFRDKTVVVTGASLGVGAAAAMVGVLYMIARGELAVLLGLDVNVGDAILIACNLGLAGYGIAVKRLPYGFHPLTLLAVQNQQQGRDG